MPTPPQIIAAGVEALQAGQTKYGPAEGIYELREAIAGIYAASQPGLGPEHVLITPGVRHAVHNVLANLIRPGDEVILPSPYWFAFPDLISHAGGVVRELPCTRANHFNFSKRQLLKLINENTKLFILNNPCNPTGRLYNREELDELFGILEQYTNIYVLVDEVYEWLTYEPGFVHAGAWEAVTDRLITISGFSKAFAMAGWRIGYMVAHQKLIQQSKAYQQLTFSGVPLFTQRAALAAINSRETLLPQLMGQLKHNRDLAAGILANVPGLWFDVPQAGFYFFTDISAFKGRTTPGGRTVQTAADISGYLLAEHRVQVFPGDIFGDGDYLRLSFSMNEKEIVEGFSRVAEGLTALA